MDTQTKHEPLAVWISHKSADGTACVPEEVWRVHVGNHEGGAGFRTRRAAEAEAETWRRLLDLVGASDLLAACEDAEKALDAAANDLAENGGDYPADVAVICRAAVAKAKGTVQPGA